MRVKSFTIAGKRYKVKYHKGESRNLGTASSALGEIVVEQQYEGQDIPEDSQNQTFCHELIHCMLDEAAHHDLSADEHLVQALGLLFYEFLCTAKWGK